jgi:outer membrane receptor protein involved in Fe transport
LSASTRRAFHGSLVAACLATHPLAAATTGRIDGRVVDPEEAPLPGVTVTTRGPSLPGAQRAMTDRRGEFRFLALSPGEYLVRAELDGYHSMEQPGVRVPLGGTVVLDLRLTPAFAEEIAVAGQAPVIDATSATHSVELSREVLENLPLRRSPVDRLDLDVLSGMGVLAPGVVPGPGGGPRVAGAGHLENTYFVDGLETTGVLIGGAGTTLPIEFVEEVQITTGSWGAEDQGALGGVINVVTPSGGNEHRWEFSAHYGDAESQLDALGEGGEFHEGDFGVGGGGPLVRDRLWYYVAANPQAVEGEIVSVQGVPLTERTEVLRYAGKLTWQAPSPSQRLSLSAFGERRGRDLWEPFAAGLHGHQRSRPTRALSLVWDATLGPSRLVEAVVGRFEIHPHIHTLDDSVPAYFEITPAFWAIRQGCGDPAPLEGLEGLWFNPGCVGGNFVDENDHSRDQLHASATWLRGRHELKLGLSLRRLRDEANQHYPGPFAGPLVDAHGVVVDPDGVAGAIFHVEEDFYTLEEFSAEGTFQADAPAVFVEDRLQPTPHLTLDLGLRAEGYRVRMLERPGEQYELDFAFGDMLAPRLGVAWDFAGDGRSKLFAHLGRYYESVPLITSLLAFGRTTSAFHYITYPADGALPTYTNLGTYQSSEYIINAPQPVVPGTKPTHNDEASVGVEVELRPGLAVGLRAVHRELGDVIENHGVGESFVLGNPGGTYTADPITGEPLTEPVTYEEPVRRNRSLELTLERPLRDDWELSASYVYSESEGNYGDVGDHLTGEFDFPEQSRGAFGPLGDPPHQLQAHGSYTWPFRLVTGFIGQYYGGTPISKRGPWPNSYERFVEPRGSAGHLPAVWSIDLHVAYPVTLRRRHPTLDLTLDAFNVTDEQGVIAVDEQWTFAPGEGNNPGECGGADPNCVDEEGNPVGNPNWGQPTEFQEGRSLQASLRLRW